MKNRIKIYESDDINAEAITLGKIFEMFPNDYCIIDMWDLETDNQKRILTDVRMSDVPTFIRNKTCIQIGFDMCLEIPKFLIVND